MKKLKVLLALLFVCALAFCVSACDSSSDESSSTSASTEYSIGLVLKTSSNAHFQDIAYGAQQAAQDYGVDLTILSTTTESDVEGQITYCEDLISQGVDALILTANDSDGVSTAVESAYDAGVAFVAVDTEITNIWGDDEYDYLPTYIGVDHVQAGYDIATAVAEKIGGEGNVVIIRGVDAASSSNDRTEGIEEALDEYSGITVVASQSGDYDTATAQEVMSDIIQGNSDIDAVICCNDLMAVGVVNALEEQGIEVGGDDGVIVAGIDGNISALEMIDSGEIYATLYDWTYLQGYWAVYNAIQILEGNNVAENIVAPSTVVTSDNIDSYLPHAEELSEWTIGDTIN